MTIVFIGDIHQQWHSVERGLASLDPLPRAAILLGDIQCERPLDELAAPLLDRGIDVHWIFGNHDNDGGPEMWANLVEPDRNPRTAQGALHARVVEIAGVRIAGLGGTFRPRIWEPPDPPRVHRRDATAGGPRAACPGWREEHIAALIHSLGATAIWPEDYDYLASQRADILVTHEAPRSHPAGNAALDAAGARHGCQPDRARPSPRLVSRRRAGRPACDGRRGGVGRHDRRRTAVARRGAAPSRQPDRRMVA